MICQNSVSFAQFNNGLSPAITKIVFINKPFKPLIIIRSGAVISDSARSWEGSAVLGETPMSDCRGFHGAFKLRTQVPQAAPPHERLHQEMSDLI